MAAAEGSSDTMHVLIEKGAKLTRTDGKGNNIVHLMVSSDNSDVLKVSSLQGYRIVRFLWTAVHKQNF